MNKKELITPIAIISLSIIFALVSFAVYLTKGNSAFWISKKFKIGALLLTFTSIMACRPPVTCYEPIPQDWITLDSINWETSEVLLDSSENEIITGKISSITDSVYSYSFADSLGNEIFKENLQAIDGKFDEDEEEFTVPLGNSLFPGKYMIYFYNSVKEEQSDTVMLNYFNIRIIE
jgi:hypothetical protein